MKLPPYMVIVLSILAGFCVTVAYVALALVGLIGQNDLRQGVFVIFSMMLVAGIVCGRKDKTPWLMGCLVASGLVIPVAGLNLSRMAMTNDAAAVVSCGIAIFGAISGAYVRRFWVTRMTTSAWILVLASAGAAGIFGYSGVPKVLEHTMLEAVNRPLGHFSMVGDDGTLITSESLRGRVVVLSFWATWCPPCGEDLKELAALYRKHRGDLGFTLLAVNAEGRAEVTDDLKLQARKYFAQRALTLPLAYANRETGDKLGASPLPKLLILDEIGNLRFVYTGYDGSVDLESAIVSRVASIKQ